VSTRKLIIASLVCGLLILVAGSAKLLQTANDPQEAPRLYAIGTTVQVGDLDVTVSSLRVTAEQTLVEITMDNFSAVPMGSSPLDGWSMLANGEITTPQASSQCVSGISSVTCVLEFVVAVGTPTLVFARDGDKSQWLGS